MQQSRLIEQLRHLTPGDFRRFLLFVESPYFNQNPRLLRLAQYLQQAAPDFPASLLDKAALYQAAQGTSAGFSEQAVHDLFAQLLRLLEGFLAQQSYEQDEPGRLRHLLNALQARQALGHFVRIQRKAQTAIAEPVQTERDFYHQFEVNKLAEWASGQRKTRRVQSALPKALRHLDAFYLAARLRLSCELINRRNVINAEGEVELSEHLLALLRNDPQGYRALPAVAVYYQIYQTLTEPEQEAHYATLVSLLAEHASHFPRSEAYQMYAYAQNYCIRRINDGNPRFLQELFALYQQLLSTEILLDGGVLAHEHYKNITTVGLRLQQFDWVRDFLAQYKARLHPDYRDNAYTYNLAAYHYEQQQFREAMKLLNQVEFTDVFYHLSAKSMLLKIYYELKDEEALRYHIQAFRAFLKRQQLPRYHLQTHHNLLRLLKKAFQLWKRRDHLEVEEFEARLRDLHAQIDAAQGISNVAWLRAKVAELAQGRA